MKAVIIGAGSAFGGRLSVDILSREPLQDSTIALCDIDEQKLAVVKQYVESVIEAHNLPANVEAGTDRCELLPGADVVVTTVSIGGPAYYDQPYESEIDIPARYGVVQCVGDTVGPGGLFRALRTAPVMLEMVNDINRLAPGALLLNYTNPMAILTWLFNEAADGDMLGLCHGVTGNSYRLAGLIDVPLHECDVVAAGINHMTWFTKFAHQGRDVLPEIHQRIIEEGKKARRFEGEISSPQTFAFRHEMIENLGYFTTESDRHFPEYVPWFQHEDRWDFMKYYNVTKGVKQKRANWYEDMGVKIEQADSIELIRSHESMSGIMEARKTGEPFTFSGNVMNRGNITNLPEGCCVELPVTVAGNRIESMQYGDLPLQCAALCRSNINFQELVVRAIRERSRELAFQALLFDPATQAVLSIKRIRQLFDEMWEAEEELLAAYE